jgi:hypothetical protein
MRPGAGRCPGAFWRKSSVIWSSVARWVRHHPTIALPSCSCFTRLYDARRAFPLPANWVLGFGSKTDIGACPRVSALPPKADIGSAH